MALGWCTECDALKPITPLGLKLGSRECDWAPVHHDREVHVACGNTLVKWDDQTPVCMTCGPLSPGTLLLTEPCPGSRKPIR